MRTLLVIYVLLSAIFVSSQTFHFQYNYQSALTGGKPITRIIQDSHGQIYFLSEGNLFQFDGLQSARIDNDSLNNNISCVSAAGAHHDLLIGTNQGTFYGYDNTMSQSRLLYEFGDAPVTDILTSGDDVFIVHGNNKIYHGSLSDSQFNLVQLEKFVRIHDIVVNKDQLIVAADLGLYRLSIVDGRWTSDATVPLLKNEIILTMCVYNSQLIVSTQESQVFEIDLVSFDINPWLGLPNLETIQEIVYIDSEVFLFVVNEGEVLIANADERNVKPLRSRNETILNSVKCVYLDMEGILWISTDDGELYKTNSRFEFYSTKGLHVQCLQSMTNHSFLAGTRNGVYFFNTTSEERRIIEGTEQFNVISILKLGRFVLFGTYDKGLNLLTTDDDQFVVQSISKELNNLSVISIASDDSLIWVSTLEGVFFSEYEVDQHDLTLKNWNRFNKLENVYTYDILIHDDVVSFASDGKGVAILDQEQLRYQSISGSSITRVFSLASYSSDSLMLNVDREGLCLFGMTRDSILCRQDMKSSNISLLFTAGKNVWVGTDNSVSVLNYSSDKVQVYGPEYGFRELNSQLNAYSIYKNDFALIAGENEIVKIKDVEGDIVQPKLKVKYIQSNSRTLLEFSHTEFNPQENNIIIGLKALNYTDPGRLNYYYKLEGRDEKWNKTQDDQILLSRLDAGDYFFKALATTDRQVQKYEPQIEFSFSVKKPFWKRWYVITISFISMLYLLYIVIYYRERSIERRNEVERLNIEHQYLVLKNQLNPHFLFNAFNTLVGYIEEDPAIAVEVVERLTAFYRKVLELKENKLVALERELELLNDYVYILNKRFDNSLQIDLNLNNKRGFIPPMTLQILVENAVKHNVMSNTNPLKVKISELNQDTLHVSNEIKRKRTTVYSTGVGLMNIKERYTLLGYKNVKWFVERDEFVVVIPKVKAYSQ